MGAALAVAEIAPLAANDNYAWPLTPALSRSYARNGLNQYTSVSGTAHAYDARGNLTADGARSFGYDLENRLTSVTGSASGTLRDAQISWTRQAQPKNGAAFRRAPAAAFDDERFQRQRAHAMRGADDDNVDYELFDRVEPAVRDVLRLWRQRRELRCDIEKRCEPSEPQHRPAVEPLEAMMGEGWSVKAHGREFKRGWEGLDKIGAMRGIGGVQKLSVCHSFQTVGDSYYALEGDAGWPALVRAMDTFPRYVF
ncbi:MAG: hypothetical protein K2P58_14175 [Hyphomonadaceae bacterium]|nr:hypothetical protein [Hyphomonadaceae bacterium]